MSNTRSYIRSIHRTIIAQWTVFSNIKNIIHDLFQITQKKEKIHQTVSLTREKLERRREIINAEISSPQSKVINFIR